MAFSEQTSEKPTRTSIPKAWMLVGLASLSWMAVALLGAGFIRVLGLF